MRGASSHFLSAPERHLSGVIMRVYELDFDAVTKNGKLESKYSVLQILNLKTKQYEHADALYRLYDVFHKRENGLDGWVPPQGKFFWDHKPRPDVQFQSTTSLFISEKKKDLIEDISKNNFTFLPIYYPNEIFYFVQFKNYLNCIDRENSFYTASKKTSYHSIQIFSFHQEVIKDQYLFIPPDYRNLYATENFRQYVQQNNLKGLDFKLIWDSEDPNYHDQRYRLEQWNHIKNMRDELCAGLGVTGGNILQLDATWQQIKRGELKL
jgi:hypothetical protein